MSNNNYTKPNNKKIKKYTYKLKENIMANERFESAKIEYENIGVDVEAAINRLMNVPVSMHCWQGDDVKGFDQDGPLTGGIQTTGNYLGKSRTPEELMADMDKAMSLIPGKKKINLHASYAIFEEGEVVDRDKICVESKVFGIGVESYTAGSAEFTLSFAASHEGCLPLMDNGHYHPTELVSDKIPALLCYYPEIALHITRGVRWDSDHVLLLDDETKEIAKEIVRCNALDRVYMALDYFDASINRISAWVVGMRSWQKALLNAMLMPNEALKKLQNESRFTELMAIQEELKTMPFGDIWKECCRRCGVDEDITWFTKVTEYENQVLSKRN